MLYNVLVALHAIDATTIHHLLVDLAELVGLALSVYKILKGHSQKLDAHGQAVQSSLDEKFEKLHERLDEIAGVKSGDDADPK